MARTTERGYGTAHQHERARQAPAVAAGHAECAEHVCLQPSRWIAPGSPWDLAHDRVTGQWLGPAHRRCNRAEGARHGNRQRSAAPAPPRAGGSYPVRSRKRT